MIVGIIVVLVAIIVGLMIYNIVIYRKIQTFSSVNQKVISLNVLQDFMTTIGEYLSVDEKIEQINRILIERYEIKYSTIVAFNGADYIIKASNVDRKHWEVLRNLHNEEMFKDSIETATPKYVTINSEDEKLPYQKIELGRAKSAMFFPLYIDNVYIGYWIIESGVPHAFDNIDTTILEVIKDNIITIFKTVSYQNVVESTVRRDKFTELNSAEYLYGAGKKVIDKYTTSTVCMFKIINLEEINDTKSRKLGDKIVTAVSKIIKNSLSEEYIFVRYMGPKLVIVFSGVEPDAVIQFIKNIKREVEKEKILLYNEKETSKNKKIKNMEATPKLNFAVTTYYKGTALEGVTKKLEQYLDEAKPTESNINYI